MTQPYFVRDYNRIVHRLISAEPNYESAMAAAVGGGPFDEIGFRQRRMLETLGLRDEHYVIDVGAGSGRLANALKDSSDLRYMGTDVVPELLDFARKKCERSDWNFKTIDKLQIPEKDGVADFVVFFSVFTHLTEAENLIYLQEAKRVIKPSGVIVVSYLDPRVASQIKLAGRRFGSSLFGEKLLNRLLKLRHDLGRGKRVLNQVLSEDVLARWSDDLGLSLDLIDSGDQLGQSVCAFRPKRAQG